jgi:hypothetical protein
VKLLDASVLLHAYDPDFQRHQQSRTWLEKSFSDPEKVGLAWVAILAFLRISTNPRAFPRPFSVEEATKIVSEWLDRPNAVVLHPGMRHWRFSVNSFPRPGPERTSSRMHTWRAWRSNTVQFSVQTTATSPGFQDCERSIRWNDELSGYATNVEWSRSAWLNTPRGKESLPSGSAFTGGRLRYRNQVREMTSEASGSPVSRIAVMGVTFSATCANNEASRPHGR